MKPKSIGDITIARMVDKESTEHRYQNWFPDVPQEVFDEHRDWMDPHFFDYDAGTIIFSYHGFVLKSERHTVVVDTCIGNDKEREARPLYHLRNDTRYMDELAAAGVRPEEVDYVMCTHLHGDHIGWNTKYENGVWKPTFPNAKYLFSQKELEYWSSIPEDGNHRQAYRDSVSPVIEAGQSVTVQTDHAIDDSLWLEPSEGHTIGHYSVRAKSNGAEAVLCGDVMHHPIQCVMPDLCTVFCMDQEATRNTRKDFFERHADTDVMVFPGHFAAPTAGFVTGHPDGYRWKADF